MCEQAALECRLNLGLREIALEHDVAAGDVGPHVLETCALTQMGQIAHGELARAAYVDGGQEGDKNGRSLSLPLTIRPLDINLAPVRRVKGLAPIHHGNELGDALRPSFRGLGFVDAVDHRVPIRAGQVREERRRFGFGIKGRAQVVRDLSPALRRIGCVPAAASTASRPA